MGIQATGKKIGFLDILKNQKYLLMMSVPFLIWVIIFRYIPIWGWIMAFQEFKPGRSSDWVGFA